MLQVAQEAAGSRVGLVGVTVLTSHSAGEYALAVGARGSEGPTSPGSPGFLDAEVARLAALAAGAGLRGVVCSPREIEIVRPGLPTGAWVIVPGIRRAGDAAGDQVRTAAPRDAATRGATHLVVGRPILTAVAPAQVLAELQAEAAAG
jgi:orotidine-5'-phosphate decarboxylase